MIKNNKGAQYIELIFCLAILIFFSSAFITSGTVLMERLWIEEKVDDLAKIVESKGKVKDSAITEAENVLFSKYGGTITYSASFYTNSDSSIDEDDGCVQQGDVITIKYVSNDTTLFSALFPFVNSIETISGQATVTKTVLSKVYYK